MARETMDRAVGIRAIFNPENAFDPSQLPADMQALYEQTQQAIASMEPAAPEGELLGGDQPIPPWQLVDIPHPLYDAVRALYPLSKPPFRSRPFDVVQDHRGHRAVRGSHRRDEDGGRQDDRGAAGDVPRAVLEGRDRSTSSR